ncbi:translation Initiation factor eIF- 4e, partial [Kipferlia bialata]
MSLELHKHDTDSSYADAVDMSAEEEEEGFNPSTLPLNESWDFFFRMPDHFDGKNKNKEQTASEYQRQQHPIATASVVAEFWQIVNFLPTFSQFKDADILVFKHG